MTHHEYLVSELRYMANLQLWETRKQFLNHVADELEMLKHKTEERPNPEPRTDLCRATKI
jgi:hypothetical protein